MEENTPPTSNLPPSAAPAPPPLTPPPVIVAPSPAASRRRGRGWMVFALVVLVLLVISVMFNVGSIVNGLVPSVGTYHTAGPRLEEVVKEDNSSSHKIVQIKVEGIITGEAMDQSGYGLVEVIKAQLKRAEEDHKVKAVVLRVDSPGGEVLASDEIARAIADFQQKARNKPVICSMGSLAASGGYYVSAPCRWIVAHELTITGSIGVILSTWNYRGLMNKVGLQPLTFKSGRFKDMLSGSREPDSITPEERAMVQALVDETYGKFTNVVAVGREQARSSNKGKGRSLKADWGEYADGRILSGTEAYKLGFVDELGTFEDSVKRAQTLAGISTANLVEYQQRFDLSDVFRIFGQSEGRALKIDMGVEPPKLRAGKLYFLSPTLVH